jgi:hypothetical protein
VILKNRTDFMANIAIIAEEKFVWALEGQQIATLNNERIITRKIDKINIADLPALVETLRLRTSTLNPEDGAAHYSVTDPLVCGIKQPGTWRGISVRSVEGVHNPGQTTNPAGSIFQVLAYGWAQTLIDTEARKVGGDNNALQPERTIQRQYVALDFTKMGDMIEGIESTKYVTNPVIEGKTYDGPIVAPAVVASDLKWRILSNKVGRANDGSGIITQTLAKNLVMTPDALPTAILLSDDKALLSPFALDTTSVKNTYVWEYRWIDPDYAQTLRNTIALVTGVIDAKVVKSEDGTCNIQVATQTNTWNGDLSQVWEHRNNAPTFAANQVVDTFSHIPLASLTAFKANLATATAGYKVSSLVDSTAEEGFARIIQTQDKLFVGAVTANNGVRIEEEAFFLLTSGVIRTTMWLGVADADLDAAMTTLLTAPTGYTALRVGNNYNGTGSCNVTRTMVVKGAITDKIQIGIEYPTFEGERITYHYPGLNTVDAKALYLSLQTAIVVGYKVDSVTIVESRYALSVVQQLSKVQVTPFTVSAVHAQSFTHTFGLVTRATTVYLNVPFASIGTVKTAINAIADIIVLDISDNDNGQGSADITYTWRTKEAAPRSLGAIQQNGPSQFHQPTQDRLWIDVNLTDKDALATAVALAMAGTAPYAVTAGDTIQSAQGQDAGDKTGHIRQRISKKPATYTAAEYSEQESFNPHGLREAVMLISVKEYPEVAYDNLAVQFADLQSFLGTPAKGRIQVSMNANETFSMRALKEGTPDWDNEDGTGVQVSIQNPGMIGETKTELATGVPVAGAAAIVAAATADADHQITRVGFVERGQGEGVIEKEQAKKSETVVQVSEIPAAGARRAQKDYTWPLVLAANVGTIWTAAETQGVAGNYVLHFRQKDFVGGMFRITSQVVEVKETTISDYTAGYSDDSITTVKEVRDAAALPVLVDDGAANVSLRGGLNLFNKYDYVQTTVTARAPKSAGTGYGWTELGGWYGIGVWRARYYHTISYHTTAAAAAAVITSGSGWEGSGVSRIGDALWQAHLVIRNDLLTV